MSEYCVNCEALAIRLVRLEGLQKILDLERIERMHQANEDHAEITRLKKRVEEFEVIRGLAKNAHEGMAGRDE